MRDGPRAIGVVGAGINLSEVVKGFVAARKQGVVGMYLDRDGAIKGHADAALIELDAPTEGAAARSTIWKLLRDPAEQQSLRTALAELQAGTVASKVVSLTLDGVPRVAAVSYIPQMQWYPPGCVGPTLVNAAGHYRQLMMCWSLGRWSSSSSCCWRGAGW